MTTSYYVDVEFGKVEYLHSFPIRRDYTILQYVDQLIYDKCFGKFGWVSGYKLGVL